MPSLRVRLQTELLDEPGWTWKFCHKKESIVSVLCGSFKGLNCSQMSKADEFLVRLDKWLHVARVFKTRSQAAQACAGGRVKVNGASAKPHRPIQREDRLEIEKEDWTRILIVKELRDKPVSKAEARTLYEDLTPPRPALDPLAALLRRPPVSRPRGSGRPTKKDRRVITKLMG